MLDIEKAVMEILDRVTRMEVKIDSVEDSKKTTYQNKDDIVELKVKDTNQQKEIDEIKGQMTWLGRSVAGIAFTVIAGIIGCIIKLGLGL